MTATKTVPGSRWDHVFDQPRHRLSYPDEQVVRFLSRLDPDSGDALDAGCGSGRHTILLCQQGWRTHAVDSSTTAARLTKTLEPRATCKVADLVDLPYRDGTFATVVAAGSLYYGARDDTIAKVTEVRRVLQPGGRAFISLRTVRDTRAHYASHGVLRRPNAERGMPCDFLTLTDIRLVGDVFNDYTLQLHETYRYEDSWRDSHWLLTVAR